MVKVEANGASPLDGIVNNIKALALINAIKEVDIQKIAKLIESNERIIWEKDDGGRNALHHAANLESPTISLICVKTLLKAGFPANGNNDDRLKFINATDLQGRTPLSWAAVKGHEKVVQHMIDVGADPEILDKASESPFHAAVSEYASNTEHVVGVFEALLTCPSLQGCSSRRVELLNTRSCEENSRRTVIHLATISGNANAVRVLLENGSDPSILDKCSYTVLHLAIQIKNQTKAEDMTELFLTHDSLIGRVPSLTGQLDKWKRAPIHLAGRLGNKTIMKLILESVDINLFQVDQNLNTGLHLAAALGNEEKSAECVHVLLQNGLSPAEKLTFVNLTNSKGETALYVAAKERNTGAAKALLLAGSEFDKRSLRNKTPLEKVYRNVPEALVVLLDEAVERSGYSPRNGMISNYAKIDFGPILGQSCDTAKLFRETEELAKICHAKLNQRQPVLSHTFVKIFVWKKWERIRWCFAVSRFLHIFWYCFCLYFLLKVYREACPFKDSRNNTIHQFSLPALSPPADEDESTLKLPRKDLTECELDGFPKHGGILLLIVSLLVLLGEVYPTAQRFNWFYKKPKPWSLSTLLKNINRMICLFYETIPFPQIFVFLLVVLTSPPLFGYFPFTDVVHFSFVTVFAFMACFCCYLEIGRIPNCRVYVNLLQKISKSLFAAILVHFPILVGFAAVFVFLLQGMPSFSSLPQAIVKVLTLSIGELDYQNVIYEGKLLFDGIEMLAFGIFVIFITVVLINFLVGLATDDVKESRNRRKEIWKLCTQIEQIMLLESFLDACGTCVGRYILKEYLMLMPPFRPDEQRRQVEIYIPGLPKPMQKELHNLNLKILS